MLLQVEEQKSASALERRGYSLMLLLSWRGRLPFIALAWKLKFAPGFERLDVTGMVAAALWGRRGQRGGWSTSTAGHLSTSPFLLMVCGGKVLNDMI